MEGFQISLEVMEGMSEAVAMGFASGVLVVSGASLIVSAFKALLRIIGGR